MMRVQSIQGPQARAKAIGFAAPTKLSFSIPSAHIDTESQRLQVQDVIEP